MADDAWMQTLRRWSRSGHDLNARDIGRVLEEAREMLVLCSLQRQGGLDRSLTVSAPP